MNILGVLLIFLLIPILFIFVIIINLVFRMLHIFHKAKKQPEYHRDYDDTQEFGDNEIAQEIKDTIDDRKERGEKIIGDDVGEYVDYEEIKD